MMTFLKILHIVSGVLGVFHGAAAWALMEVWEFSKPRRPDYASGETVRWESTDDDGITSVFYITPHEDLVWYGAVVVAVVSLLVCGALTLVLKWDARREGRTTLY